MAGTTILEAEVTDVSGQFVCTLIDDEELALPCSEFPWFKAATIQQILHVLRPTSDHLDWPEPDVDLTVESIRPWKGSLSEPRVRSNPAMHLARLLQCGEPTETRSPQLFAGR
jgi:Protein of unknown function (DUF2442)